ncbi:MAG: TetR/AcrR family transcriptional regulator [Alkalibacterium sp.]|uniref:TetR/AcrR family transcriptional regulator n=1 Tax=Alkalibacterium sp. TaxID=1872447 RepID=UPI00264832A9|nr:TetR/AcrR family transcriptional regulator [Alkalibacterium sp.]MDN6296008.1 TetR/AcrR family transcriptional regulator [Alkalibacterium sp.]
MEKLDLRVQKTYRSLIDAFEKLLVEKEFEKILVTELCDAAMIRRPTFYSHFLDKYDFFTFFIRHKMNLIFDNVFKDLDQKSADEAYHFFILVFEQLLNQPDNLLELIFSVQIKSDIITELEGIQDYGQKMLKKRVNIGKNHGNTAIVNDYKSQIIMGITIKSVYWYKNNKNNISKEDMTKLYEETLEKLW